MNRMIRIMMDMKLAIVNLPSLVFILGYVPPFFKKNSEINLTSYCKTVNAFKTTKHALFGNDTALVTPPTSHSTEWFFLNGICTDENMWRINAKQIEDVFGVSVSSLHNTTKGIVKDIAECIFGRTFDILDKETIHLYHRLKKSLLEKDTVIVLAHSQGGIIIANILTVMMKDPEARHLLDKLEIYTFASASDEMPEGDYYSEHFANGLDYVSRIGVIEYASNYAGCIYNRPFAAGHLLNPHYLIPFSEKKFCNGFSRLFQYVKVA